MSLTIFLTFCILGMDFLIYALFQWALGEKYRSRARKLAARNRSIAGKPQVVSSRIPRRLRARRQIA